MVDKGRLTYIMSKVRDHGRLTADEITDLQTQVDILENQGLTESSHHSSHSTPNSHHSYHHTTALTDLSGILEKVIPEVLTKIQKKGR